MPWQPVRGPGLRATPCSAPRLLAVIRALESCPDFHPSLVAAAVRAARGGGPTLAREAAALSLRTLVRPESATSAVAPGQEAALILAHMQAVAECLEAEETGAAAAAATAAGAPPPAPGQARASLLSELTADVKLATRRLRLLGAERFAGTGATGAAALRLIADAASASVLSALRSGCQEAAVTAATALCVLLPLADGAAGGCSRGAQGRTLLLAVQALLNLQARDVRLGVCRSDSGVRGASAQTRQGRGMRGAAPCQECLPPRPAAAQDRAPAGAGRTHKQELAAKLLSKASQHLEAAPPEQAAPAWPLHHLLALALAARQSSTGGAESALTQLRACRVPLALPQLRCVVAAAAAVGGAEVHAAAAELLAERLLADGSLPALALLPDMLQQLALSHSQQLGLYQQALPRLRRLLAAPASGGAQGDERRAACRLLLWLAGHAWNAGAALVGEGQVELGQAFLREALALARAGGGAHTARMEGALHDVASAAQEAARVAPSGGEADDGPPAGAAVEPAAAAAAGEEPRPEAVAPAMQRQRVNGSGASLCQPMEAEQPDDERRQQQQALSPRQQHPESRDALPSLRADVLATEPAACQQEQATQEERPAAGAAIPAPASVAKQPTGPVPAPRPCHTAPGLPPQPPPRGGKICTDPDGGSQGTRATDATLLGGGELPEDEESEGSEAAGTEGRASWLDAVFAAQAKALGGAATRPRKPGAGRQQGQPNEARPRHAPPPVDSVDALSLLSE